MVKCHSNMLSSMGLAWYRDEGCFISSRTSACMRLIAVFLEFMDMISLGKRVIGEDRRGRLEQGHKER